MDNLRRGNNGFNREIGLVHVLNDPLGHPGRNVFILRRYSGNRTVLVIGHIVKRRHVDSGDMAGLAQETRLVPALIFCLFQQLEIFQRDLFPFPQYKQIHKGSQRLRVIAAGAAGQYDRRKAGTVRAAQGQSGQIQHVQNIGICHLIAQRESDGVKLGQRISALQGVQGDLCLTHLLLHIPPGSKAALTPDVRLLIHHAV